MPFEKVRPAFSLFEILAVIAVLSVLIITSYLVFPKLIIKAYDARRKADLDKIKINLELYYSFASQFPRTLPDCNQPLTYKTQILLASTPCDPTTKKPYYYQVKNGDYQSYRLYSLLGNNEDNSIKLAGCQGGCGPDCSYNYGVSSTNTDLTRCSYVCAPGGGQVGSCELYQNSSISLCPKLYYGDSTCENACNIPSNRCKNASGKNIPY